MGLGQDVVSGISGLGLDFILDNTEKAFVDAVAANPLEVQLAMVKSPYLFNGKLTLTQLVAAATTLQNYHPKLREAVWAMPDKAIQLPSGSLNPSTTLGLVVQKEAKTIKVLDYVQTRIFDNAAFWQAFNQDEFVEGKYPSGFVYRQTWVRWDASQWPVKNWQALISMMQRYDPSNYNEDDLDKILDGLGIYEYVTINTGSKTEAVSGCIYCYGRTWDLLEETGKGDKGNNGYTAYFNLVGSEGNIVREWLKTISDLVWKDSQGLLVRPLLSNNQNELWLLLSRDPRVNSGSTTAFANLNVTYMDKTRRPDGTYSSTYQWAKGIVGDAKDERAAVLRVMDWYLGNVTHFLGDQYVATTSLYKDIFPQNPTNPPAWAIPLVKQTGSGLNITGITAALRSLGIPAEGIIEGNTNTGLVIVNGQKWYYGGNSPFNAILNGITSCNIFGTYEQVNLPARRGDGSFCR